MKFSIVHAYGDIDSAVYLLNLLANQGHEATRIPYENVVANGLDWFFQLVGQNGSNQIIAVGGHNAMPLISGALLPQSEKTKIEQPGNYTIYTTTWRNYRTTIMAGYDTGETRLAITVFMGLKTIVVPFTKEAAQVLANNYDLQGAIFSDAYSSVHNITGGQAVVTGYEFDFNNNWFMLDFQMATSTTGLTPFDFPFLEVILGIAVVVVAVFIGHITVITGLIAGGIVTGGLLLYEWLTGQQKVTISKNEVLQKNQQLFLEGKITLEQFDYNNKLYENMWKQDDPLAKLLEYAPYIFIGLIGLEVIKSIKD